MLASPGEEAPQESLENPPPPPFQGSRSDWDMCGSRLLNGAPRTSRLAHGRWRSNHAAFTLAPRISVPFRLNSKGRRHPRGSGVGNISLGRYRDLGLQVGRRGLQAGAAGRQPLRSAIEATSRGLGAEGSSGSGRGGSKWGSQCCGRLPALARRGARGQLASHVPAHHP